MSGRALKILKMRHATSDLNMLSTGYSSNSTTPPFYKFTFLPAMLDCSISVLGRLEIQSMEPILRQFNVKYIFTSPLRRTLETCRLMIDCQKPKLKPKIFVEPNLRELIMNQSDIPLFWKEARYLPEYEGYDFSEMEQIEQNPLWFLNDADGNSDIMIDEYRNLGKFFNLEKEIPFEQSIQNILSRMKLSFPRSLENSQKLSDRVNKGFEKIRSTLLKEIDEHGEDIHDHEVLIVTHYNVIKCIQNEISEEESLIGEFNTTEVTEMQLNLDVESPKTN